MIAETSLHIITAASGKWNEKGVCDPRATNRRLGQPRSLHWPNYSNIE